MILQAANSGGVTPSERNDDPKTFLFEVAELDFMQLGFMSFALHLRGTVVSGLWVFALHFYHQSGSCLRLHPEDILNQ